MPLNVVRLLFEVYAMFDFLAHEDKTPRARPHTFEAAQGRV